LLASVSFLTVQLALERRRQEREGLASQARRLRNKGDQKEVTPPKLEDGWFHVFLSHVWGTGQDQMRIVKQRLLEMVPHLSVFLDVDDLEEIGDLEGYIERTVNILVFASQGYFRSKNCMRELVAATTMGKPILALVDPEHAHGGGLTLNDVSAQLLSAAGSYDKWGFDVDALRGEALYARLFESELIEWNRIGVFQDITMRLIAERLLPGAAGATYVERELVSQQIKPLPLPRADHDFHVFCSPLNPGAAELIAELAQERSLALRTTRADSETVESPRRPSDESPRKGPRPSVVTDSSVKRRSSRSGESVSVILMTTDATQLNACDHMLLYLTAQTWTQGEPSAALAEEIRTALNRGVHVLLAHEMTGTGQEARHACEFASFFSCVDGATPSELLKRGIYSEVAVPLKGGAWREVSILLLAKALAVVKERCAEGPRPEASVGNVLGLTERSEHVRSRSSKARSVHSLGTRSSISAAASVRLTSVTSRLTPRLRMLSATTMTSANVCSPSGAATSSVYEVEITEARPST